MRITNKPYGTTADGQVVTCYTMTNRSGVEARVLDYGCALTHLLVPDRTGRPVDVVLGYDDLASYEKNDPCFGAVVGRYANRIKNAAFTLGGREYTLSANDGANHLHGVLSRRVFRASVCGQGLRLTYVSPDGEEGFPGTLEVSVTYLLDEANVLSIRYEATSDRDTVLNLTNHSYFNLSGHDSGTVDDQLLQLAADEFLETADDSCPTGHILPAEGAMDFRRLRRIGQGFPITCEQMELVGGYDHCYVLRPGAAPAALAYSPETGISLTLATTEPGLQFYSGNYLPDSHLPGKGGVRYPLRGGFALEAQHYPCSPNYPAFPTTELKAGETYRQTTLLQFQVTEPAE